MIIEAVKQKEFKDAKLVRIKQDPRIALYILHKETKGKKMQGPTLGADKVMTIPHSLKKRLYVQYSAPTYYNAIWSGFLSIFTRYFCCFTWGDGISTHELCGFM